MWLTKGLYKFVETDIPAGYTTVETEGIKYDVSMSATNDLTFHNTINIVSKYDLYINEIAPKYVFPSTTSITYNIIVGNAGSTGVIAPIVTDSKYGDATWAKPDGVVVGDINKDGMLDAGEEWSATLTLPVSGLKADDTFSNTVSVSDPLGLDINLANNTVSTGVHVWWKGGSLGYWKNNPKLWAVTGYSVTTKLGDVFTPVPSSLKSNTFLTALGYKGRSDTVGASQILLRSAVAALLNSCNYPASKDYPLKPSEIISQVNDALKSGNRATMLTLATKLEYWNNGFTA